MTVVVSIRGDVLKVTATGSGQSQYRDTYVGVLQVLFGIPRIDDEPIKAMTEGGTDDGPWHLELALRSVAPDALDMALDDLRACGWNAIVERGDPPPRSLH